MNDDRPIFDVDPAVRSDAAEATRFDGIVCFGGEDWWYHNRGHYDIRLNRALSEDLPVLYVNSIGMRVPRMREGRMFGRRIARKLRSLRRGFVRVDERFGVLTAPSIPGATGAWTRPLAAAAIRRGLKRMGIRHPLAWVACPAAEPLLNRVPHVGVLYQRTDRYESFLDVDATEVARFDRHLKRRADLVVYCSDTLRRMERPLDPAAVTIDHGVDAARFEAAGDAPKEPLDVAGIPGPRIGFVGAIDAHTFDPSLIREVAARLPDASFVLVGGCTLPEGWCDAPNVHLLGRKPLESVAQYMASCDVLIMPWRRSPWIQACHPVKLKEYLAVGRPIVTTPFSELSRYRGLVQVAEGAAAFADAIRDVIDRPFDAEPGRRHVRGGRWIDRAGTVLHTLAGVGLRPDRPISILPLSDPRQSIAEPKPGESSRVIEDLAAWIHDPSLESTFDEAMADDEAARFDAAASGEHHDDPDDDATPPSDSGDDDAVRGEQYAALGPDDAGDVDWADDAPVASRPSIEPKDPAAPVGPADADADAELDRPADADATSTDAVDRDLARSDDAASPAAPLRLHRAHALHHMRLHGADAPIAAALVLAGGLRPTALQATLGLNPVDFRVTCDATVADDQIARIRQLPGGDAIPIRIVANNAIPAPAPVARTGVTIEQDPHPFRGPAGVLRDIFRHLPEDAHVLVMEAARWLDTTLERLIADHLASAASVTVGRNPDGTPAGVYVVRADALRVVPHAGFVDIKEQWLPRLRRTGAPILVHDLEGRGALPLRTRPQLVEAARVARRRSPARLLHAPVGPGREPVRTVCRGAIVGPSAEIFDSIVMPGAYVGPRATVVRSIVGPDTVVPEGTDLVDCVLHAGRLLEDEPRSFCAA